MINIKKKEAISYSIIFFGFLFLILFDGSFSFAKPNAKLLIVSIPLFLVLSCAVKLVGLKKTAFLLIPFLTVFFLFETGSRVWLSHFASRSMRKAFLTPFTAPKDLGTENVYTPHHYTLYNLMPDLKLPDGTRHNHLGMRDHRELKGKNGDIRVVFIGGSTTYTIGIKDNENIFSYRLEKLLNEFYEDLLPDGHIQVINAGMGGATSAENLLRLVFFVSELRPDLVVIQHGLNDVWPRVWGDIQSDFSNYRKRWGLPDYFLEKPIAYGLLRATVDHSVLLTFVSRKLGLISLSSIGTMITRSDVAISDSSLDTNSAQYFERNTQYMVAICKSMGAKVLLATEAYTETSGKARTTAMPEHNQILSEIAQEEGVLFYDFHADMTKDSAHMPDGRHVNQAGSDLKADLFHAFLLKENVIPTLIRKTD